jgi:MFS family permease
MLRVISKPWTNLKTPVYASLALAFASFGDAFLYPFLPVHAEEIGIQIGWVGLLLSINRFIRIFSNPLLVKIFSRYGFKWMTLVAVILAIISTAGYGMGLEMMGWLMLRVLWGISFSALRLSSLGYALQHPSADFSLGISRGIYELGPMFALLVGPLLIKTWNPAVTFLMLAAASLPALYFAWHLPDLKHAPPTKKYPLLSIPSTFNLLTLITTFLVEGMLIVLLGKLLLETDHHLTATSAIALAAAWLVFRRVSFLVFAPAGGYLADQWGLDRLFSGSVILICLGFILLCFNHSFLGLSIIFIANSINASLAPGGASQGEEDKVQAVAENATWRDIGAALGALAGGLLLSSDHLHRIFMLAVMLLLMVLCLHLKDSKHLLKKLLSWN